MQFIFKDGRELIQKDVDAILDEALSTVTAMKPETLADEKADFASQMADPDFWNRSDASQIAAAAGVVSKQLEAIENLKRLVDDAREACEMADLDPEFAEMAVSLVEEIESKNSEMAEELLFSGEYDRGSAIVTINPGEGGLEAQDFARMLYQMYVAYAANKGWKTEILDFVPDELHGTERACIQIDGDKAYGMLHLENGVHRLVRISPTDEKGRRHTSFASVEVMPVLPDTVPVELDEADIKWDVYRSSGPGGQGVNTTDSAVRATHIPTGIVVTCQVERSQLQNKERARAMLRSKLWEKQREEEEAKRSGLAGEKSTSAWGHAIRHYVLYPYKQIKDDRSEMKYSNADGILAGDMDELLMDLKRWNAAKA